MNYKILTHDLRPPLQGGAPVWDGTTLPFTLPAVALDTGPAECSFGWNFVTDLAAGFRIAGLWPTGRPSRVLIVEPDSTAIVCGDKCRATSLTILREATIAEIEQGIVKLSEPFGEHADAMTREQIAWRRALARPRRDPERVEARLHLALETRGLDWTLQRFDDTKAARDAWTARDAWAARDAWDAWAAWDAWTAWDAWAAK